MSHWYYLYGEGYNFEKKKSLGGIKPFIGNLVQFTIDVDTAIVLFDNVASKVEEKTELGVTVPLR